MKTSVIEVHDMLSVLTVDEVEKRIVKVPGVESATVNFAAGNATVRYDETRLEVADIKAIMHQRAHQSAGKSRPRHVSEHKPAHKHVVVPTQEATPAPASTPEATVPKASPVAPAPVSALAAPADDVHKDHAAPVAQPSTPVAAVPKTPPVASAVVTAPAAPAAGGHEGHAKPGAPPAMSADMAHEMGHSGTDLPAMVRDMRNRFWICLIFTVPIFVYAPMGSFFEPPAPPFGLELNLWLFFFASAAVLYPSWPFFVSAWRALRKGILGMAALVVLSVGTGYLFSAITTFFFKEAGQFFEAVAVLLVFILLGHWLEMRARAGASSAIKALMDLTPAQASVIRNGTVNLFSL